MRILILFLFLSSFLSAQTFNKRIDFGFVAQRPGSILPIEDGYLVTGIIIDAGSWDEGLLVAKLTLEGEVEIVRSYFIEDENLAFFWGTLKEIENGSYWVSGYSEDSINLRNGLAMNISNDLDTLSSFDFNSPHAPENQIITPLSFSIENANRFAFSSTIFTQELGSHTYFTLTDSLGNIIVEKIISFPNEDAQVSSSSFVRLGDHYYLFARKFTRESPDIEYFQRYLLKMDTLGNTVAENAYPSIPTEGIFLMIGGGNTIRTFDNNILTTGGRSYLIEGGTYNKNMVYIKVNQDLDTIWTREFREPLYDSVSGIRRVTESPDSSGYVGVGRSFRTGNWHGQISKVSPEGDSLWHRIYHYQDWADHEHEFWDVESTPDGGYIMAGYSNAQTGGAFQQGYIVKTDEYGCVVPGCHIIEDTTTTVNLLSEVKMTLKLYPNPTPDVLNIFFRYPQTARGIFRIIDVEGKVVRTFNGTAEEVTHVVSLDDLVDGVYFVQYMEEGQVFRSERFVKMK